MSLNLFPWDRGEKPYFVNDEGFEWYVHKELTDWCTNDRPLNNLPPLNAVVFLVSNEDRTNMSYVVIDKITNGEMYSNTGYEAVATWIDVARLATDADDYWLMAEAVISDNQDKVLEYKGGKYGLLGFFVGELMKRSKGKISPAKCNEIMKKLLNKEVQQ